MSLPRTGVSGPASVGTTSIADNLDAPRNDQPQHRSTGSATMASIGDNNYAGQRRTRKRDPAAYSGVDRRMFQELIGALKSHPKYVTGDNPIWDPNPQNPMVKNPVMMDHYKKLVRQTEPQLASDIRAFVQDRDKNPYYGEDLTKLVAAYQNGEPRLLQALVDFDANFNPKGVPSRMLGITNSDRTAYNNTLLQAELDEIYKKTDGLLANSSNLELIRQHFGISNTDLNNKRLRELILLDDWPSILKAAIPLAVEHGPKLLDWLHDRFVKPMYTKAKNALIDLSKNNQLNGHDAGLTLDDFSNNNVLRSNKVSKIPEVTTYNNKVSRLQSQNLQVDGVATDYLSCVICPERFRGRAPLVAPIKSGIVAGSSQYILRTDTSGNTTALINPAGVCISTATNPNTFIAYNPSTSFDIVTGAAVGFAFSTGPVGPLTSNLRQFRIVGMSFTVTPITSMTSSAGNYQVGYFQDQDLNVIPTVSQVSMSTNQFYQSGNSLTTYRGIYIPDHVPDYSNVGTNPAWDDFFVVTVTGAPVSTNVAKIDVSYVLEVIPVASQAQLTAMEFPTPGISTLGCFANCISTFPCLQMLTYDDAFKLANTIKSSTPISDNIIQQVIEFSSTYSPPKMTGLAEDVNSQNGQLLQEGSFDQLFTN